MRARRALEQGEGFVNFLTMTTLTFGTANHPFRAALPQRVLRRLPRYEPEVQARMAAAEAKAEERAALEAEAQAPTVRRRLPFTAQDLRDFLLAYTACFIAASAWLS
ncbi:hypothetical protein H7F51_13565 [Novosphingobium flavum]|uniref:Uncharacterized protein n=1 Tax=Novosphingobium flavum TaxID=1778672 RepID=A0A7X1FTH2_9SPHN|nr:hypothetical protein [Novosphingobium flavum]MBC2666549.1 hypothetical protein [Novosphingobium flavum]